MAGALIFRAFAAFGKYWLLQGKQVERLGFLQIDRHLWP